MKISKSLDGDGYARLGDKLGLDGEDMGRIREQFTENHEKALVVMQVGGWRMELRGYIWLGVWG